MRLAKNTLTALLLLLAPATVLSETGSAKSVDQHIAEQNARIERLERALAESTSEPGATGNTPQIKYKKGYLLTDGSDSSPFALKVNGRLQFRYNAFSRSSRNYNLGGGSTGMQDNISDFEIERGRLEFSGHALDPDLHFYLNLDFDTDDNHDAKAHDFWFNYVFSEALDLYAGKAFVPGSREWLDGSTSTHLSDRSLATSFFRPDRSVGLWATGDLGPLKYRTMLANGFSTTDLEREDVDNDFTYATTFWSDLVGDYGSGRGDLEFHEELAVRAGGSFTYSPVDADALGKPLGEADAVRLSNGLRLDDTGALADGVTVAEFDIFLYALDLSAKYRGFAMNSEVYLRAIDNIKADGTLPRDSYIDRGGYIDIGYFVLAEVLEPVIRYSFVDGAYGDSTEYAAGINYFISPTHKNKLTFDVARIDDSGVSNSGPNYTVGQDGTLYRIQWQVGF